MLRIISNLIKRDLAVSIPLGSMAGGISINHPDAEALAVRLLKSGSVIALPTDTIYGLACDATKVSAINKLYDIKQRNEDKPVAICVGNISEVSKWAVIHHLPQGLLKALLPGPVTLILTCANKLDKSLSFNGKVGIRIPDYPFIRNITQHLRKPLALTSANVSNEPSSLQISDFQVLWDKVSGVFDGGVLGLNRAGSTVIDLSEPDCFHIIRDGIAYQETITTLNNFGLCSKY